MIRYAIHFIVIMQENNVSMQKQITLFKKTLENHLPRQIKNAEELSNYLSNSIFLISVGSNDYLYNYLQSQNYNNGELYDMNKFGDILMFELQKQLKVLFIFQINLMTSLLINSCFSLLLFSYSS
jgi:hypothetical protein